MTTENLSVSASQVTLTFSPDENIQRAFIKLSAGVKTIIRSSNFNVMQEACMEEAKSPKNIVSKNLITTTEQVNKTFDDLFLTLTKNNHWNFLDTRMMEAMVTASMVPAAQQSLKNFKNTFFSMKLDEVLPDVPVIALKPNHTILREVLDKDWLLVQLAPLNISHISEIGQTTFNKLYNLSVKELMRQFQFDGIYQAVFTKGMPTEIIKPLVTLRVWHFKLDEDPLPYSTPQTAGLRKMTLKDIPNALVVTNKYTSQFEIGQVFQNEEEFIHWFLPPPKDMHVVTYVVEDSITGNITDMFSFQIPVGDKTPSNVLAIVYTKTPSLGLVVDLLLCAKQHGLSEIFTYQFGLLGGIFDQIFVNNEYISMLRYFWSSLYLYNYSYPEVYQNKFVLFACPQRIYIH